MATGNICPASDGSGSLGRSNKRWKDVQSQALNGTPLTATGLATTGTAGLVTVATDTDIANSATGAKAVNPAQLTASLSKAQDETARANIALLAFKQTIQGNASIQGMADGAVDAFEDETGIASSSMTYDAIEECYSPRLPFIKHPNPTTDTGQVWNVDYPHVAQMFTAPGYDIITKVRIRVKKVGTPTGTITANMGANSGSIPNATPNGVLAGAGSKNIADLPSGWSWVEFNFRQFNPMGAGGTYCVFFSIVNAVTDANNQLYIGVSYVAGTNPHLPGNFAQANASGTWTAHPQWDMFVEIYDARELISKDYDLNKDASSGWGNYHIRQVIRGSDLAFCGNKVSVGLKSYGHRLFIDNMSIVERDGNTANGIGTPTPLSHYGKPSFDSADTSRHYFTDTANFIIDPAKEYLVCFDLNAACDRISYRDGTAGQIHYESPATDGCNQQNMPGTITERVRHSIITQLMIEPNKREITSKHDGEFAALAPPSECLVTLFEEDMSDIELNSDLKAYASRDGGTTWTAVPLENKGTYETGKNILSGKANVSAQPSGTACAYKIETLNNKSAKLHGSALQWR